MSYIRSEHPDRTGSDSYGMDRTGSFALCVMARPFSNLNADGERTFDWLKEDLGAENFIVGYKVYDDNENLIASDHHTLVFGGSLSLMTAYALALIGFLIF